MTIVSEYTSAFERNFARQNLPNLNTSAKKPWSVYTANDGGDGFRFEVHSGDQWASDIGRSAFYERSEIAWGQAFAQAQDIWIAFEQRIAFDALPIVVTETGSYQDFCFQIHALDTSYGVSPFLAANIKNDGPAVNGGIAWEVMTRGSTTGGGTPTTRFRDEAFVMGRWYRHVVHFKITSAVVDGLLQWWRDGMNIVDVSGIPLSYTDDTGPYPKFGIYRTGMKNIQTADYRNIVVGTTGLPTT